MRTKDGKKQNKDHHYRNFPLIWGKSHAFSASGVDFESSSLTRSPVAMCGMQRCFESIFAYVPFPTPGHPKKTSFAHLWFFKPSLEIFSADDDVDEDDSAHLWFSKPWRFDGSLEFFSAAADDDNGDNVCSPFQGCHLRSFWLWNIITFILYGKMLKIRGLWSGLAQSCFHQGNPIRRRRRRLRLRLRNWENTRAINTELLSIHIQTWTERQRFLCSMNLWRRSENLCV